MEKMRKEVREANWYAHGALVLALAALIVATLGTGTALYVARHDARDAKRHVEALAKVAGQKRAILHEQDVRSCESRHLLAFTLISFLAGANARNERLLADPSALRGLPPQVVKNTRASVRAIRQLLDDLRTADCDITDPRDVLPLNQREDGNR